MSAQMMVPVETAIGTTSREQAAAIWERMLLNDPNNQLTPREIWTGPQPINPTPKAADKYASPFDIGMYKPAPKMGTKISTFQIDPIPVSAEKRDEHVTGDIRRLDIAPIGVTAINKASESAQLTTFGNSFEAKPVDSAGGGSHALGAALIAAAAAAFMLV